jgi:hypothetical protein
MRAASGVFILIATLGERLRVRTHPLHAGETAAQRQKVVMNRQRQFAADRELRLQQQVERARHRALSRILDRHDAEFRRAGFDRAKHLVNRRARQTFDRLTEVLVHRLFAVRADRAEIGGLDGLFERAARGHDLAPDRADMFAGQRAVAHILQTRDHLLLALGAKHRRVEMLLHLAHFERHRGALIEERDQLRVERVDALAKGLESGIEFVVHA